MGNGEPLSFRRFISFRAWNWGMPAGKTVSLKRCIRQYFPVGGANRPAAEFARCLWLDNEPCLARAGIELWRVGVMTQGIKSDANPTTKIYYRGEIIPKSREIAEVSKELGEFSVV